MSPERIAWIKNQIAGWASAFEQEFCVGDEESTAVYAEMDAVLTTIDALVANQKEPTSEP